MDLEVCGIRYQYVRNKDVFHNLSFTLHAGDILSILGGNGAGKSTLLHCIAGLYTPMQGEILINGKSQAEMSRNEIARSMGYVPQIHGSTFGYSVLEYAVMGRTPYIAPFSRPSKEDYRIARYNLGLVGMDGMEEKIFTELSGGEQQLAMIARVLTQEAGIILLDEPTNHLDFGNQYRILDIMKSLAERGFIVISTTHNPAHVLRLGGQAAILSEEHGFNIGPAELVLTSDSLSELYGMDISLFYSERAGRKICFVK